MERPKATMAAHVWMPQFKYTMNNFSQYGNVGSPMILNLREYSLPINNKDGKEHRLALYGPWPKPKLEKRSWINSGPVPKVPWRLRKQENSVSQF